MATVELLTSLETFDDLHLKADGRDGKVRVDKTALRHLLIDHSEMLVALKGAHVSVRAEPPKRRRESITEE